MLSTALPTLRQVVSGRDTSSPLRLAFVSRRYGSKKSIDRTPHEWRQRVTSSFPENKLLLEDKIVHGRSRDYSWRNPYLKQHLDNPFVPEHAVKASLFEPEEVGDVRSAARMCYENDIPLVIRGEGTGFTAGAYNFESGLVLDTKRLNQVLDVDASKGTIKVEAGMKVEAVREVAQSIGWDMRISGAATVGHSAALGGLLQTTPWGLGSARYGSLLAGGHVLGLTVVPITADAHPCTLDGSEDANLVLGALRSLGTSALVSDITLALTPALFWVDVAVSFPTTAHALAFAWKAHNALPALELRELAVTPSSMLTASLNQGERKHNIHFLRNKIPTLGHSEGEQINEQDAVWHLAPELQIFALPEHVHETEALVTLSVNEAALPYLNQHAKLAGGHTIYLEHNRGGYGWLENVSWQHASTRLGMYYSNATFSHYEIDMGIFDPYYSSGAAQVSPLRSSPQIGSTTDYVADMEHRMALTSQAITQTVETCVPENVDPSTWVDESEWLSNHIKSRPAYMLEFVRRADGRTGVIAQLNFRTQTLNFSQLERRLNRINQNLRQLRQNGYLRGFVDPNKYDPNELFVDDVDSLDHAQLRREAKEKFDPKKLLNPRKLVSKEPKMM